jgi:diguanylate cyclase (GGDEF)-like protein
MVAASNRHRLLLVDDQPDNLDFLERLFREEFDVHRATHPQQALELLRESPFEVIITDHVMPGMTGVDLLARSIELAPDAVRIVITAFPDVDAAVASVNQARAFRFFTKPVDTTKLAESVRQAVHMLTLERENRRLFDDLRAKTGLLEGLLAEKEGLIEARVHMRTRQLEAEIERLRTREVLDESGAYARVPFRERVAEEVTRAARFKLSVSLIMLAAPILPVIEIEQGHERASHVARTIAEMLRLGSRRFDVIGRQGSDRFAVLLPQCDAAGAASRLERIRLGLSRFPMGPLEDLLAGGALEIVGASASFPGDGTSAEALLEAAERALDAELPQPEGGGMLY